MREFPRQVEGSLGPWYQKVNAAVSRAQAATTSSELRDILGEPDAIEPISDEDRRLPGQTKIDERYPSEYWVYCDPYRPRFKYRFGISGGIIVETSRVNYTS